MFLRTAYLGWVGGIFYARMVELVDTPDLESDAIGMRVRLPLRARPMY